jgi:Tfp pilus assembly protein PilX
MKSTYTLPPERGAVALGVAVALLFAMTLVVFFANRAMLFEQRTSANQYRSTKAFEMADAGIEWALAQLNANGSIASQAASQGVTCDAAATAVTFRERYLVPNMAAKTFTPITGRAGCSISAAGVATCACPGGTNASPTLGASTDPRYTVEFLAGSDPTSVQIVSRGCTAGTNCAEGTSGLQEAEAVVRVLVKVVPQFPNSPGAGLITGSAAVTGGNLNVINTDVASNGITINAGTVVEMGTGTAVTTLAGTPPRASVLDNDPSLSALTNLDGTGEAFFRSFFGVGFAEYKSSPQTWYITGGSCGATANPSRCSSCGNAADCGSAVSAKINDRETQFWSDTDVAFNNGNLPSVGTVGTADRPIVFAGDGNVELRSNLTAYGMFYVASGTATENWDYSGSGSAKVFGAFVSRGDFNKGSGTLDLIYDPNIFGTGDMNGLLVKVPGSWRDKLTTY